MACKNTDGRRLTVYDGLCDGIWSRNSKLSRDRVNVKWIFLSRGVTWATAQEEKQKDYKKSIFLHIEPPNLPKLAYTTSDMD